MRICRLHFPVWLNCVLSVASIALLTAHFAPAQEWTPTSAPNDYFWSCIASSADGTRLIAGTFPGPIFTSTNSGATWISNSAPIGQWYSVASSADGTKLAASSFTSIYTSQDSGATWISNNVPVLPWYSIASSADGNKLMAVADSGGPFTHGGPIYTSTNAGTTWTQTSAPNGYWSSVASSADGTKLVAAVETVYNGSPQPPGGPIYISTDSGVTWTPSTAPINHWRSVASSADGIKLAAVIYDGPSPISDQIYTSTNSGATWTATGPTSKTWYFIASSADGKKLAAVIYNGLIYTSTNSGTTWISNNLSAAWNSIAASADGNKLAATSVFPHVIYTSQSLSAPTMNITPTNGNIMLSWIVPSTNFMLQQNMDLTTTNWSDMTNTPFLNLTTLQNQVILSPTNSDDFFRLASP